MSSQMKDALLFISDSGSIRIETEEDESVYIIGNISTVEISSRLGNTPRTIKFTNDAQFVTLDNNGLDEYIVKHRAESPSLLYTLESHLGIVLVAAVFTVVLLVVFIWKGLPGISQTIATKVPERIIAETGYGSLELLDKFWLKPSQLSEQKKIEINTLFSPYIVDSGVTEITFRRGIGPNALILPDGIVIFTDELIKLAANDNELIAILFHEIGHLKHKHFLRRIIQDSLVTLVFATLFGDIETADLFLVAPTLFLDAAYSRQFEIEADRHAFEMMNRHEINLNHFKSILKKLEEKALNSNEELPEDLLSPRPVESSDENPVMDSFPLERILESVDQDRMDILDTIIRTILNETELPFIPALAVLRDWEHIIRTQLAKSTSPGHLFSPLQLPDNF